MPIHFSMLAWRIPWTEEPGRHSPWGGKESGTTKQLIHRHTANLVLKPWITPHFKLFGYDSKAMTLDNMTRMGIIACAANFAALAGGMAAWPMSFSWFASLGHKN